MIKNKVILFDIDYTLFDVEKYRTIVFKRLQDVFPNIKNMNQLAMQTYDEVRQSGSFQPETFSNQLISLIDRSIDSSVLKKLWWDKKIISSSIYPEAESVLKQLESNYTLGIFSSGFEEFQSAKIKAIKRYFVFHHIHIHPLKDMLIPNIVKKYQDSEIFVVDDYIPVLEKVKKTDKNITTIWVKRGRLSKSNPPSKKTPPDMIIENLTQLVALVENRGGGK